MLRKVIKTILFLPLFLCLHSVNLIASDAKDYLDNVLEEEVDNLFLIKFNARSHRWFL